MAKDHCIICGVETSYDSETPNDQELGAKVRKLYWISKG